jgi:hypothetical protein
MTLLISSYIFVLVQNALSFFRYGGNAFVLSVIVGTLLYIIVGFLRRQPSSRIIAMAFHVFYQVVITFAMAAMLNLEFLRKLLKDVPVETLSAARIVVIITFVAITAVNVAAIMYLMRHKKYFLKNEPPQDSPHAPENPDAEP